MFVLTLSERDPRDWTDRELERPDLTDTEDSERSERRERKQIQKFQ